MNGKIRELMVKAAAGSCPTTIGGWVWYCDVHDTHGNADSSAEAEFVSEAHETYFILTEGEDVECDIWFAHTGGDK